MRSSATLRISFYVLASSLLALPVMAQSTGALRGYILDPTGAVIPDASIQLTHSGKTQKTLSRANGFYAFPALPPGLYALSVNAKGFAPNSMAEIVISAGKTLELNVSLTIAVQHQKVTVQGQRRELGTNPEANGSALIITGAALNALSDNPDVLKNELEALAGPAAGPNGGEIYVDGFAGDRIPPKSSIREIRVNQNPFSAEHARLGYGRIEILTKPGANKLHGAFAAIGTSSSFGTANPLIQSRPQYYRYNMDANVSGPVSESASYFLDLGGSQSHNQNIVDAINPEDTTSKVLLASPAPTHEISFNPRFDLQLGKNNTLTVRDSFFRRFTKGDGVGGLNLPSQAYDTDNGLNALQIGNTTVFSDHLLMDTRFQWQRIRRSQIPRSLIPAITVMGAFTDGGNGTGTIEDHQDNFDLESDSIATWGRHTIHFGARARIYRDANYSTSGENGTYFFYSLDQYAARTPGQYHATVIEHPLVRATLFDGALFYQDSWGWKPNLNLGYGIRFEGQNRIGSHTNWAPRIEMAWAPWQHGKPPGTVLRAGYGWFYDRFTVPSSFDPGNSSTPYIMQAIHDNRINQQSYVVNDPTFFNPSAPAAAADLVTASSAIPSYYTVSPHLKAALNMQGAIGLDHKFGKHVTANLTYLYTRGIHQYLTNNISAPAFDPSTYTITGPLPDIYNYQFQSSGIYRQNELVVSTGGQLQRLQFSIRYNLSFAKSDTQGVHYFPSVPHDPRLDYGRAAFAARNNFMVMTTYRLPYKVVFSTFSMARSGVPYNITIGSDSTGNNQNNARPTYGACGMPDVVTTRFGCLDTNPAGKGEKMIPYGIGVGPANVVMHVAITKAIGIGPKERTENGFSGGPGGSGNVSEHGLGGGQQSMSVAAKAPRKFTLTLAVVAENALNIVNLAPPNGVLNSTLFGTSQALAGEEFSSQMPGNRIIRFGAILNF